MTINTKLDPGASAYLLFLNKITEVEIESIDVRIDIHGNVKETYNLTADPEGGSKYTRRFDGTDLHKSKKDLLDSL